MWRWGSCSLSSGRGRRRASLDGKERRVRHNRKVTDIFTWLQCYGSFVAVLTPAEPQAAPELMAYMGFIVRARQDYEGLGWVRYNAAFRRQAALTRSKKWSVINATLFTMNFSGLASRTRRCELCFATSHSEQECAQREDPDPDLGTRLKNLESAVLTIAKPLAARASSDTAHIVRPSDDPCRKWNTVGCTYLRCRYAHVCSGCRGDHPLVQCPMRGQALPRAQARPGSRPY